MLRYRHLACALALAFTLLFQLPTTRAQDLFTTLTGIKTATLAESQDGKVKFSPVLTKRANALNTVEKRYEAVVSATSRPDAEAVVNAKNKQGQTALAYALYTSDGPAFVDLLLDAGADPNAKLFGKSLVWHALTIDDEYATFNALTLLDYGADPNAANDDGETALHCAAARNNFWVVQRLLTLGADANATYKGKKPAQLATTKTVKDLFANWGKKPYPYSALNADEPAVCRAASRNNYWALKRLLDAGADKNAAYKGKKAVDMTSDKKVRALLGGKGSGKIELSQFRSEHIFVGEYRSGLHNSGGHSFSAFNYMLKCGMKPKVCGLFENGVQVCSVEKHTENRTADDPKNPRHSLYPTHWTKGDIFEAVNALALANVNEDKIEDDYNGVRVIVILRDSPKGDFRDVITAYPSAVQPLANGRLERVNAAKARIGNR